MAGDSPFTPQAFYDQLNVFDLGIDSGSAPLNLPKNQLAFGLNLTVRGDYILPRSAVRKMSLNFFQTADPTIMGAPNVFQGGCYYKPDSGAEKLVFSLNGRLWVFSPGNGATADVWEQAITGGPNPASAQQAWMWQSEKWVIWNDGASVPVFYDGSTVNTASFVAPAIGGTVSVAFSSVEGLLVGDQLMIEGFGQMTVNAHAAGPPPSLAVTLMNGSITPGTVVPSGTNIGRAYRSNYGARTDFRVLTTTNPVIPAIGATVVVGFNNVTGLLAADTVPPGDIVTIAGCGTALVTHVAALNVTLKNISMAPIGGNVPQNVVVSWSHFGTQLPPGRMGAYGKGRNWICLTDGRQFVASDLVGGSSGTSDDEFRDAVLEITENTFLAGGGNFFVPGTVGAIRAMIFTATLDTSLGQGPLLVVTPEITFSCEAPTDRLTWQDVTNPILTESVKANGGLGQWSTINVNSDTHMRAVDGIRSVKLARRDFENWSNTPISFELSRFLPADDVRLLRYGSSIFFDNRTITTVSPEATDRGVIHKGWAVLNTDPVTTVRNKENPCWDGLWTAVDTLQLIVGEFNEKIRAFAFVLNRANQNQFELWEILTTEESVFDNNGGDIPIRLEAECPPIFRPEQNAKPMPLRLMNGELFIDDLIGRADIEVYFKPDSWNCWERWKTFSICNDPANPRPGYRPRVGLGEPPDTCEPVNDKPFREGFFWQIKLVITGYCSVKYMRFKAISIPAVEFAPPAGCCPGESDL